jgi:hypothetical protein
MQHNTRGDEMNKLQIAANARAPYAAKIVELTAERDELVAALRDADKWLGAGSPLAARNIINNALAKVTK